MTQYLIILLVIIGAFIGGEYDGRKTGSADQSSKDQIKFDEINSEIAKQKVQANALLEKAQADVIAKQEEIDQFKNQLEKSDADRKKTIADLQRKYAGDKLQFTAKIAGCGSGGSGSNGQGNSSSSNATTTIVLPDKITSDLRQLAVDADTLSSEYKKCFDWANK